MKTIIVKTTSLITCPHCGHKKKLEMPITYFEFFYDCETCKKLIKPLKGDCCIFCSYGSVPCPPIQKNISSSPKIVENKIVGKSDRDVEVMVDNPWFDYKFLIDNGWSYKNGKYIKK